MNKDLRYIPIHREFLENRNVSFSAKGLYTFLFTLPFRWEGTIAELEGRSGTSETEIKACLFELEKNGYLDFEELKYDNYHVVEYKTKVKGEEKWACQIIILIQT